MTDQTPTPEKPTNPLNPFGPMTPYKLLEHLWAGYGSRVPMSQEELHWFSGATDEAERQLLNLEEVIEGLGCLVSEDGSGESVASGNFQNGRDVATLLFSLGHSINALAGMVRIGSEAEYWLRSPGEYAEWKRARGLA